MPWLRREAKRIVRRWRRRGQPKATDGLRLHLGCGSHYWPGWVNIDGSRDADSDRTMDFRRIGSAYPAGSVKEIAMIHAIGYLRLWEARDFLRACHGLLAPGGTLALETPDIQACADRFRSAAPGSDAYLDGVRGFYAFGLDQIERREAYYPYHFGWTPEHLEAELLAAGFTKVEREAPKVHLGYEWRDFRLVATK